MIVDDEPNILMSLEYAFKKKAFQVYVARDGTEALEIADEYFPDVVLLDIMMPHLDGYETLKRLRANKKLSHTKVVFLSAKSKEADLKKGLELGVDSYETKPFSIKRIIAKVEDLIS
ncbi:Response regulator receiver protein in cluster with DNA polymerase III epsilon subunit [Croceitalea dokdonensis DOKDO 023]|uniref:Response regulator receiver protein in cluster with DNA polymerase III epsilon subunit n=1 Tax=Croceitalea dokdonensis DOKDO 023 TaxID=1300341 RepID=A0A0P7AAB0_9FLAO|nr:Response regulator receiver protein in cluster with DNA polymerase III epsilon subunit [Croceitalea dokdonensis DOKDO 023]